MKSIIKSTYDIKTNPNKREMYNQFKFSSNDPSFHTIRQFHGDFEVLPISLKSSPPDPSTDSKTESAPADDLKETAD